METEPKATRHPIAIIFFLLFTLIFIYVALKLAGSLMPSASRIAVETGLVLFGKLTSPPASSI